MPGDGSGLRHPIGYTGVLVGEPISPSLADGTPYFHKVPPAVEHCTCCHLPKGGGFPPSQTCRGRYDDPVAAARGRAPGDAELPATKSPFGKMVSGR